MNRSQSIQRQFGAAASRYATSRFHQSSPDLEHMLKAVPLTGREQVLDVGTGTGHTALAFAPQVASVIGLDMTEAMLVEARALAAEQRAINTDFELGNAMDLPYDSNRFDLVTCRVCAHHFADVRRAVEEMARVLRPGGHLLVVDSVSPEDPAEDTYLNCIELIRDPSHVRNYCVTQWKEMLEAAGLFAEYKGTWGAALDFEDWVERMGTGELERTQLRALFDRAPDRVRATLGIRSGARYGFDIPIAMLVGRKDS
jgi:ubiquinone/menaquinone biosynthesis C-methylase UbiE